MGGFTLSYAIYKTPSDVQRAVLNFLDQTFDLSNCGSLKLKILKFLERVASRRFIMAYIDIRDEINQSGKGSCNKVENRLKQAYDDIRDDIFDGVGDILTPPELECAIPRGWK